MLCSLRSGWYAPVGLRRRSAGSKLVVNEAEAASVCGPGAFSLMTSTRVLSSAMIVLPWNKVGIVPFASCQDQGFVGIGSRAG